MTLHEKILYYRKQARLFQEELAARVGVSRQAVSKWELGDSTPEVDKLVALARVFGVTTDELLSPEEPAGETQPPPPPRPEPPDYQRGLRGVAWLICRYGWLAGVYIAVSGAGIALVGGLARYSFLRMTQSLLGDDFFYGSGWSGEMSAAQLPLTIATVILAVGLLILATGVILAVVLYRKGRKGD